MDSKHLKCNIYMFLLKKHCCLGNLSLPELYCSSLYRLFFSTKNVLPWSFLSHVPPVHGLKKAIQRGYNTEKKFEKHCFIVCSGELTHSPQGLAVLYQAAMLLVRTLHVAGEEIPLRRGVLLTATSFWCCHVTSRQLTNFVGYHTFHTISCEPGGWEYIAFSELSVSKTERWGCFTVATANLSLASVDVKMTSISLARRDFECAYQRSRTTLFFSAARDKAETGSMDEFEDNVMPGLWVTARLG